MKKYTTSHGTYYLIDEDKMRAKRVKADGRNDLHSDGEWFPYYWLDAFDYDTRQLLDSDPQQGKAIFFCLDRSGIPHDFRITTDVTEIEDV